MSKIRITITDMETGEKLRTIEGNGYGLLVDQGDNYAMAIDELSEIELSTMIASSKDFRDAAKIGLAIYEVHKDDHMEGFNSTLIKLFQDEDDD